MLTAALIVPFYVLGLMMIIRAVQGRFLSQFWLFYSYLIFALMSGILGIGVYLISPAFYPSFFWFRFLTTVVVEFAVLVEVADHIFNPYPAIRQLGRLLIVAVCFVIFLFYMLPFLPQPPRPRVAILALIAASSLIKSVIIIVLLGVARYYSLPLGRNISGLMLGFSIYLGNNYASFTLEEWFGWARFGASFGHLVLLGSSLCMLVWTVALWRYAPALPEVRDTSEKPEDFSESLTYKLDRFDTALMRLLRK